MIKFVIKQLIGFFLNIPFLLANFFPRRKDLWLFSSWSGQRYLDNPKYIYLYAVKQPEILAIWLTKNKKVYEELRENGLPVVYAASLEGVWLQLRCGVVVFTHAVQEEFIPFLIALRVLRVQTWHGVPLKKIWYDDEKSKMTRNRQKLIRHILPYRTDHLDLVLATNKEDRRIFRSAFNVESDRVVITGYPRNDVLLNKASSSSGQTDHISSDIRRVIYMPTFRGEPGSEFPLLAKSGFDYPRFDKKLDAAGIRLEIKLHPVQTLSEKDETQIKGCMNIVIAEESGDIYALLTRYDALITDYSGIYFDFMLTRKPIFMAPFDMESYLMNDRTMYYDYKDICPCRPCVKWDDVIAQLIEKTYDYTRYNALVQRFHCYQDNNSAKRAFSKIMHYTKTL